ncbi:ABC transporter ATP-binding protein [Streptomyces hygroscopicus subsp. hygroscopicus]|uniref:ABC transporter ATP-binding protein n=1 Tax=Streptomyces sp. KHY 26 TaxID=3097359 RepID=UPI00249FE360|nr:ABC transporter ATP-binding protein [Streptomyces hygroscopicus]GLX50079.1 ABC transporter ATP-binding protein [Streptomyces hygroscopicus subsp. hygroscopicus]
MTKAITVAGLHKSFGRTHALDGLDLDVESGEVHGFLGPNGAGKSTAIRVLLGLLRADAGAVRVLGRDPWRDAVEVHRRIAYVPGDVTLWRNLSGGEVIDLFGRLHQGGRAKRVRQGGGGRRAGGLDPRRRDELVERFELDPTKKGRTYSKGNRQKVALVAAFASDVDLLILDEPTSGLDPLMEEVFRRCVEEERARGRTVLLSSHILSEVERLCDRVSIIRKGRTVESGSLAELRHLTRTSVTAELARVPVGLADLPGVHDLDVQGRRVRLQVDTDRLDGLLRALGESGVRTLTSTPPTLEELFLRHYAQGADDTDQADDADGVAV